LVKDITNQPEFEGKEDDAEIAEVGPFVVGHTRKVQDTTCITLP